MSISSSTNLAIARRSDVAPNDKGLENLDEVARATNQKPAAGNAATAALAAIAAYIPTEVVTIYVAVLATIGISVPSTTPGLPTPTPGPSPSIAPGAVTDTVPAAIAGAAGAITSTPLWLYVLFVVLTPVAVWFLYAAKVRAANKRLPKRVKQWPKWEMVAATVSFAVWAAALPSSPLLQISGFNTATAAVVALITSFVLGLAAPVFAKTPLPA